MHKQMPCKKEKEEEGRTGKEGDSSDAFRMHRVRLRGKGLTERLSEAQTETDIAIRNTC